MKKNKNGFTLIELLITLTIIGLLASLLLPNFSSIFGKAKQTALKNQMNTIQLALESYNLSNGAYPTGTETPITELCQVLIQSGNLSKIPNNPYTGKTYTESDGSGKITYTFDPNTETYTLKGFGKQNQQIEIELSNT